MAYCIAKNNLPFANFGPLLTLLRKKVIWTVGKHLQSLLLEYILGRILWTFMKLLLRGILKNLSANDFQCIYGQSRIHRQNRRAICVSHFQKQNFLRVEPPTEVQLTCQEAPASYDADGLDKTLHTSFDLFLPLCRCPKVSAKICETVH